MISALYPLAVVLGLLALCWWILLRFLPRMPIAGGGLLRVVAKASLTTRQGVAIIEVEGVRSLISWGEGGVRLLGLPSSGHEGSREAIGARASGDVS